MPMNRRRYPTGFSIAQKASSASNWQAQMIRRQADVLVKVKKSRTGPVYIRLSNKCFEKLELRRAGGRN